MLILEDWGIKIIYLLNLYVDNLNRKSYDKFCMLITNNKI